MDHPSVEMAVPIPPTAQGDEFRSTSILTYLESMYISQLDPGAEAMNQSSASLVVVRACDGTSAQTWLTCCFASSSSCSGAHVLDGGTSTRNASTSFG